MDFLERAEGKMGRGRAVRLSQEALGPGAFRAGASRAGALLRLKFREFKNRSFTVTNHIHRKHWNNPGDTEALIAGGTLTN